MAIVSIAALSPETCRAANGSFTRLEGVSPTASVDVLAEVVSGGPFVDDPPEVMGADPNLIGISSAAQLTQSGALASSQLDAAAAAEAALGSPVFLPKVESSLTIRENVSASVPSGASFASAEAFGTSGNVVPFTLDLADGQSDGFFHGTFDLVGMGATLPTLGPIGGDSSAAIFKGLEMSVTAMIDVGLASYQVTASYDSLDGLWHIDGNLPGDVTIDETAAEVDRHFEFTIPISDGEVITFTSSTFADSLVTAEATNSHASVDLDWVIHASAEGYATSDGGGLQDGDFDGDGDVDGADFLAWQVGLGTSSGALREQGDADADADVDAEDLLIWSNTFGIGLPAISSANAVPEPMAIIMALAPIAIFGAARRSAIFRNPITLSPRNQ